VGIGEYGAQRAVLCVEREPQQPISDANLIAELKTIASAHPHTQQIDTFLMHPGFPVDIRHNAKIGREQLARWAALQLGKPA
jgi:hypothetical protein